MTYLKVRIVKTWDIDNYPGMAECSMFDAFGTEHRFQDKIPIFSVDEISSATLPYNGIIRCSQCRELNGMIQVDTEFPDHVESIIGQHLFYVLPRQLTNCKEGFL